jgi:DNA-binding PadR family transcriptional regulator
MASDLEIILLTALQRLGGEGYSTLLHERVLEDDGKDLSPGALLTTLYRMEEKGFVSSSFSDPIAERGGRRRRMFRIEGLGQRALQERELLIQFRAGIQGVPA